MPVRNQATRANEAQILHTIKRQRMGLKPEFAHMHPIIDALLGSLILAFALGGLGAAWIKVGAGL